MVCTITNYTEFFLCTPLGARLDSTLKGEGTLLFFGFLECTLWVLGIVDGECLSEENESSVHEMCVLIYLICHC